MGWNLRIKGRYEGLVVENLSLREKNCSTEKRAADLKFEN